MTHGTNQISGITFQPMILPSSVYLTVAGMIRPMQYSAINICWVKILLQRLRFIWAQALTSRFQNRPATAITPGTPFLRENEQVATSGFGLALLRVCEYSGSNNVFRLPRL